MSDIDSVTQIANKCSWLENYNAALRKGLLTAILRIERSMSEEESEQAQTKTELRKLRKLL